MALFCASAWMMKGGGKNPATMSSMSDDDPYEQGKTKVNVKLSSPADAPSWASGNPILFISNKKSKFVLKFKVVTPGFTQNAANVEFRLELRTKNKWKYTSVLDKANLSSSGSTQSIDISTQINKSGEVKQLLIDPSFKNISDDGRGQIYLLFETNTEICSDQIACKVTLE